MTDTLEVFGTEYTNVAGIKAHDNNGDLLPFIRPQGTLSITQNGTGIDCSSYANVDVAVSSSGFDFDSATRTLTFINSLVGDTTAKRSVTCTNYLNYADSLIKAGTWTSTTNGGEKVANIPTGTFHVLIKAHKVNVGNFDIVSEDTYSTVIAEYTQSTAYCKLVRVTGSTSDVTLEIVNSNEPFKETIVPTTLSVDTNGTYNATDGTAYTSVSVNVSGGGPTPTLQTKTKTYTPSTSQQTEQIVADSGYDGLSQVNVTVDAMPTGTAGTPTATKGTASNHAISVTPSVTNTTGYISGGTINGTAVSVSASELVSGTYTVSASGTADVTNYASISVPSMTLPTAVSASGSGTTKATVSRSTSDQYINIPTGYNDSAANYKISAVANGTEGTPTATKGTVSNHAISVTPSVMNTAGYISGGTKTGTAVTVSASELVSGTYTVDSSGTKDVTNYASASVPAGTAGTPSAAKGAVSNHSISITPSVTNVTGWITGSTKSGTAVSVTASELVSGSYSITSNGTYDVTNYASAAVSIPIVTYYTGSAAPSAALGSNGDIYLQS